MKTHPLTLATLTAALLASPAAFAHPGSTGSHLSQAVGHSGAASVHAVGASGEVATSVAQATAGTAALAFWTGGSVVAGTGAVVRSVGNATLHSGAAVMKGGDHLWDFASGDPSRRPVADRTRSVPPPRQAVRCDPPPSEVMRTTRR